RAIRGAPLDRALTDCTALLNEYDDDYDTMLWRCVVLYKMKRFDEAVSQCTTLLKTHPRNADALYIRGLSRLESGNADAAKADIAAAEDADYRIVRIYRLYGVKMAKRKAGEDR
ncbi:MAG: hypothetical protein ACTHPD_04660, partial [Rhizomicrobium sp.]